MSATPRPWTAGSDGNVYSPCGHLVARCLPTCDVGDVQCSGDAQSNAEMIGHRVSAYEALTKALGDALALATCSQSPDVFEKFEKILAPALKAAREKVE